MSAEMMFKDDLDVLREAVGDDRFKEMWEAARPKLPEIPELIKKHWPDEDLQIVLIVTSGTNG